MKIPTPRAFLENVANKKPRGVALDVLRDVMMHTSSIGVSNTAPTVEDCYTLVLATKCTARNSFIDTLSTGSLGQATVFVTCPWSTPMEDVIAALEHAFPDVESERFWMDILHLPDVSSRNLDERSKIISRIGNTYAVMVPWDEPSPVYDARCLWDMAATARSGGCKFSGILPATSERAFKRAVELDCDGALAIASDISIHSSRCGSQVDLDCILAAVEDMPGGANDLNMAVEGLLRDWLQSVVDAMIDDNEDNFHLLHCRGTLAFHTGNLTEARVLYRRALVCVTEHKGEGDPFALVIEHDLSMVASALGLTEEANRLVNKVRVTFLSLRFAGDVKLLRAMGQLAIHLRMRHERGRAEEVARRVVSTAERELGEQHPLTLSARHSLGAMLLEDGDPVAARYHLHQCLQGKKAAFGTDDPSTLKTAFALADVLLNHLSEAQRALDIIRVVVEGRRRRLGPSHPETERARELLVKILESTGETREDGGEVHMLRTEGEALIPRDTQGSSGSPSAFKGRKSRHSCAIPMGLSPMGRKSVLAGGAKPSAAGAGGSNRRSSYSGGCDSARAHEHVLYRSTD